MPGMSRDHRSVSEQTKSGFLIVTKIVVAFAIAVAFMAGCVLIGKTDNWHRVAAGWLLAVASVALMTMTVRFWAAGFFGFIAYGALRSVAGVFFADRFHVSTQYLVIVSASIVVMAVLSHRFISKHVQITAIDRVSLVLAAMCVLITVLLGNTYRGIVVFNVGNVALLASWWKASRTKQHRHKNHVRPTVMT